MTTGQSESVTGETPEQVLQRLLQLMGFEAKVERFDSSAGEVLLHVSTPDAALLIGRNAQVLEAIQTVIHRIFHRGPEAAARYVVDIEHYRERRKDKVLKMALEAAEKVERTGNSVRLPPMRAHERRIVHQALKDRPGIKTVSEASGREGEKYVVVCRATS